MTSVWATIRPEMDQRAGAVANESGCHFCSLGVTGNPVESWAVAMEIQGKKVLAAGSEVKTNALPRPSSPVIDLDEGSVMRVCSLQ